ncbi:hypothetical protein [Candidatus Thiodiazotropha sp. LNASS1]|uniref:hypothetical protein n=1 Tax=Candidatus Thiodiazotropha sp. LNASS1 TaxID=3096260 RepID=UPI0034DE4C1D
MLVLCVILFGIVSTLGSFHNDDDDDITLIDIDPDTDIDTDPGDGGLTPNLSFTFDRGLPLYLSYKDGDSGSWQNVDVTGPSIGLNITDPSGFFSLLTVCDYRAERRAYLFRTSLSRYKRDFLLCDETNATATYNVGGTIGYPGDNFTAQLSFTNAFRSNWYSLAAGVGVNTAYSVDAELDDDEPTTVDLYYQVFTFGQFHVNIARGIDLATNPTINYTPVASDVGEAVSPDVSAYLGLPDYKGFRSKLDLLGTKVQFQEDDTSANPSFQKLPASKRQSDDIYFTSVERENVFLDGTQVSKVIKLRNNPDSSLAFDEVPNYLPTLSFSSSVTDMIRVDYDSAYDNGVAGMDDTWRRLVLRKPEITWNIYHSSDRFDSNISIPVEATDFASWSVDWNVVSTDLLRLTHYATTTDKVTGLTNYLASEKQADASQDGLDMFQVSWRWSF